MGFIDDLKKGLPGIQLAIPDAWKRQEEQERRAVLIDSEHRVGWHILHAPWRADLRPEFATERRRDMERHARFGFEQHYQQVPVPEGAKRPPARTNDPSYSPIIAVEYIDFAGVPAVMCIRRVASEQLMEAVVGNILIPLATGIIDITAFQHTQETGYRETGLLNMAMQKYPGEGMQKLAQRLGQTYFDDPQFDAQFPTHPLTSVRAAFAWLRSLPATQLKVTAPQPELPAPGTEVELPMVGCAIAPPPRYVAIPPGVLPLPAGVAVLSKVILEGADDPQMLDIRQIAGVALPPEDRAAALLKLAERQVSEWQAQGATQIELSHEPFALPAQAEASTDATNTGERVALAVQVKMVINGATTQTVARWIAEGDGRVFRIGVATPPYVPVEEAAADVDATLKSFRRLPVKSTGAWLTSDLRLAPAKRAALAGQEPA